MATKRVYIADFYDANGKRHRSQHATRAEAQQVEAAGRAQAAETKAAKLTKTATRFREVAAR